MANKKGTRAVAGPALGIGTHRYTLYTSAWERVLLAENQGFYLEAVTLLESLISDRLESRAKHLTGQNHGFSTLGELIKLFRAHETAVAFSAMLERMDDWRKARNTALHEMVKFSQGEFPTWEERVASLPMIVSEGKKLLREFAALDEEERAQAGVRPPATWPNAFSDSGMVLGRRGPRSS